MRFGHILASAFAALVMLAAAAPSHAGIGVAITVAPPPLPVYEQPPIPGPDYMWTPGYWSYEEEAADYYWVPGAWVMAPEPGLLWTPGYWGWNDAGYYAWNDGYWGPEVGFYGGVAYGFGYTGVGFYGGYWQGGGFYYNRAFTRIGPGVVITNVYTKTVIINNRSRVCFNGGFGGLRAQATVAERAAAARPHIPASALQHEHQRLASRNHDLRASVNKGKPSIAAVQKGGDFHGKHFGAAKAGGPYKPVALSHGCHFWAGRPEA